MRQRGEAWGIPWPSTCSARNRHLHKTSDGSHNLRDVHGPTPLHHQATAIDRLSEPMCVEGATRGVVRDTDRHRNKPSWLRRCRDGFRRTWAVPDVEASVISSLFISVFRRLCSFQPQLQHQFDVEAHSSPKPWHQSAPYLSKRNSFLGPAREVYSW